MSLSQPDALQWIVDETMKPDSLQLQVLYHDGVESHKAEHYTVEITREEIDRFRKLWHYLQGWDTQWMGVQIAKYPTDLWVYHELMVEQRYDLIVECGTFCGGSALYLAQMCTLIGCGRVITVDIDDPTGGKRPQHAGIEYYKGSSTAPETVEYIRKQAEGKKTLVILDSDHSTPHVLAEMKAYAPLASYLIVEDTNINGHPIRPASGPGPGEAVATFLASPEGAEWEADRRKEKFLLTANPGGYLRRKA